MSETIDLDEIAALYRCPVRHARDVIVKQPSFPPPVPGSTHKYRVWFRREIKAFLAGKYSRDYAREPVSG